MARKPNYGRECVALLATAAVLTLGFLGMAFAIITSLQDPLLPLLACFVGVVVFFWLSFLALQARSSGPGQGGLRAWFRASRAPEPVVYAPRRVRTSRSQAGGANAPPTADDVRDLKETSANTWVPSSVPKDSAT